jgi:ABC-type nitrate/sulfonate/bicarbonate transport system substrate-binding protein
MKKRLLIMLSLLSLIVAACGDTAGDDTTATTGAEGGETGGEPATGPANVIRFTFAPDPVWDYINDNGIKEEMEAESGVRVIAQSTWDEFGIYAGGFADVVSVGDFEVPTLDKETGQTSVIFGKYNIDRSVIAVPSSDTTSQTLEDLVGKQIAVWDSVSSTLIWGIIAKQIHDLDFRTGGGDFELVQVDITNTGPVAAAGDTDGAIVLPDFAVNELMTGALRVLYDGQTSAELYANEIVGDDAYEGPMINVFLSRQDWYEEHREEVKFFLEMWEAGIVAWQENQAEIISSYPQHFAVETDEQIAFMQDWLAEHDWFVSTVYLDEQWIEDSLPMFDVMRENGFMAEDEPNPIYEMPQND